MGRCTDNGWVCGELCRPAPDTAPKVRLATDRDADTHHELALQESLEADCSNAAAGYGGCHGWPLQLSTEWMGRHKMQTSPLLGYLGSMTSQLSSALLGRLPCVPERAQHAFEYLSFFNVDRRCALQALGLMVAHELQLWSEALFFASTMIALLAWHVLAVSHLYIT